MGDHDITSVRSNGTLDKRPVAELRTIYSSLVPGTLPEFKSKAALVRAILMELGKKPRTRKRAAFSARKPEPEPPNRKPWFFDPTKAEPRSPRKGTKREKLIAMLRKGATFGQIEKEMGWTYKQAFVQMRAVNRENGYGFTERNKVLSIYTYEEGPPE
tara:strand:+ start:44580 stop:45053 length:474 start_codon:yes stop_codon:yes gene_type:complete